ncbi:MAG: hypothetical protein BWY83_02580 [bacterium ADurb.Bin478]|nr:MAG: hypothetical protein BWY83_02580 [bacterium ADurb.Bin478]
MDLGVDDQPVDDDLDVVFFVFIELDLLVQLQEFTVHADAYIAVAPCSVKELAVFALAATHDGRQDLDAALLRQRHHLVDNLLNGLAFDLFAAAVAIGNADARVKQTQVIIDLGHRAYGGTGIAAGGALFDGDGRRQAFDIVHIRFFHQPEKLAGIGGQGFHIAALALGIERIEGQGRFAGTREAGDHHHFVARDLQADVFQVVFAGAANDDFVFFGHKNFKSLLVVPGHRRTAAVRQYGCRAASAAGGAAPAAGPDGSAGRSSKRERPVLRSGFCGSGPVSTRNPVRRRDWKKTIYKILVIIKSHFFRPRRRGR